MPHLRRGLPRRAAPPRHRLGVAGGGALTPAPGWYDDPAAPGSGRLRFWDGGAWTARTHPEDPEGAPDQAPAPAPAAPRSTPSAAGGARRAAGPLAAAAAVLAKSGGVLLKGKVLLSAGSALVSVAAYATLFTWSFAVGLVALLLAHEAGHALAFRARGARVTGLLVLPFLGAVTTARGVGASAYLRAESALAGPAAGGAAAAVLALGHAATGSRFLEALAYTGFLLNALNLLPLLPLDGGQTAGALDPRLWLVGAGLAGVALLLRPSALLALLLALTLYQAWQRWRGRGSAVADAVAPLTPVERRRVAAAYLLLAVALVAGAALTYTPRSL